MSMARATRSASTTARRRSVIAITESSAWARCSTCSPGSSNAWITGWSSSGYIVIGVFLLAGAPNVVSLLLALLAATSEHAVDHPLNAAAKTLPGFLALVLRHRYCLIVRSCAGGFVRRSPLRSPPVPQRIPKQCDDAVNACGSQRAGRLAVARETG